MVYDPVHRQTVLFGGTDTSGTALAETWVYDGTTWTNVTAVPGEPNPPARLWAGMAFDTATGTAILFGGCAQLACSQYLGDTWSWNGSGWTNMNPSGTPSPRRAPAMANSPTQLNGGVLLFGGYNGAALGDMYIWDGANWNTPEAFTPTAREWASMSYDAVNQEVVMFGGDNGTTPVNETWLWDGNGWAQANPATSPAARSNQGQVWDPVRQLTVLFGGSGNSDTWLWNGTTWAQETTATSPPGRSDVNMAYDTRHAQAVIFGGQNGGGDLGDTWTLGYVYTQSWMQVDAANDPSAPSARTGASAVTYGNDILLFGGWNGTNTLNDTWVYTGDEWGIASSSTPPARQEASMVYDAAHGKVVLFGGETGTNANGLLNDTWLFTNGVWAAAAPATSPGVRDGAAMVYDAANSNVMLFGGFGSSNANDTWIWNGTNWAQVTPATTPTGRIDAALVFDYARNQVLMFGGFETLTGTALNDTWVWNGTNWTQLSPANSPPGRGAASMVFDSVHGTVILFGGQQFNDMNDTWQWDGVNWTLLNPAASPTFLDSAAAAFLPSSGMFLFGGQSNGTILGQAWTFGSPYANTFLATGFNSQSYSSTITPAGGVGPYTFSDDGVPVALSSVGLSLNPTTGAITGTDNLISGENVSFGIKIKDSQGQIADLSFELRTDSTIAFSPTVPPLATVGTNYNAPLSATGGTPPFTYSATGLPAGLAIQGSSIQGSCQGTSSSPNVSITAIDSVNGMSTAGLFTISCNPAPLITNTSPLAQGLVGQNYGVQLTTNAVYGAPGASPYTWSAPANSLPPGLSLGTTTGQITGIPTATGTTTFTVTFTDAWGATTNKQFQITVLDPLTITTTQLAIGNIGFGYPATQTIAAVGGTPGYTFSASSLPPGLQINTATGAITGTPTSVGTYQSNFTVVDSATNQVSQIITVYVVQPGSTSEDWVQLFPATSPPIRYGAATFYDSVHSQTVLFGGTGANTYADTYSWNGTNWTALSPANSPPARSGAAAAFDPTHQQGVLFGGQDSGFNPLNDTWLWNGTTWTQANPANSPGARSYAMMAWDGQHIVLFGGSVGESEYGDTWIWDGTNWTQANPSTSPAARDSGGMAYDSTHGNVVLFGGNNPPAESDYDDTWTWNGTNWTQANPANSPAGRNSFIMAFDSVRGETVLFGGFSQFAESDMSDTWAWNGTNWIQLTPLHNPAARDTYSMVYDPAHSEIMLFGGAVPSSSNFYANDTWIFEGPFVTSGNLPAGTLGVPYSDTPPEVGGIAPLTYTDSGAPGWLSINASTGALTGTPNATGTSNIGDIVIDSFGVSSTASLSLTINIPSSPLVLSPTTLPNATAGANYSEQLSASGGVPNYTFSATGLPTGLQLNSNNQIVGQCTASSANVILKVTDSASETATVGPLTVTCNAAPAITTTSPLPDGVVNTPYSNTFKMTGGTAPLTWSLGTNNLPGGFQLSSAGVLTGSSTTPISATLSVTVTDFWGASATQSFTLNFESVLTVTTTSLPADVQGTAYPTGTTLAVTGGTGSGTYTFSATGLPGGLHINASTGAITGIPGGAGIYQPAFTVTDQTPQTVNVVIPIQIISNTGNPNWTNLNPSSPPGARDSYAMAYDNVHSVTVLYGGTGLGDTWTFGFPSTWTKQTPAASPIVQSGAAMAWMASQNNMVLFGGLINDTSFNQTWTWNGANWTQQTPNTNPPARSYQGMSPDSAHHTAVMFGGSPSGYQNALNDTWVWNGTNWTAQTPSTVPPALYGPSLADGPTGPVLFGGVNSSGNATNQTWVWNGSNWIAQNPVVSPPPRSYAGMVYNSQTGVTILFGGASGNVLLHDTWQWNGFSWIELDPAAVPSARSAIGLSFDLGFSQIVMFGGTQTGAPDTSDTWTFGFPAVTSTTLPAATAGLPYSAAVQVIGGTPPYFFQPTGIPQNLPNGLNLNLNSGQITGATQSVGAYSVGIAVGDSQTGSATIASTLSLTVNAAGTLVLSPATLPDATASTNYSEQLSAAGGVTPYNFSAAGLPAGLQINVNNQIAGVCTAGSTNVMLMVLDSATPVANGASVGPLTVHCNALPSITGTQLPSGVVGVPYSTTLQASGGTAPFTWTLGGNSLPAGFQLSSAGVLTGTAQATDFAKLSVKVADFWNATSTKALTLNFYPLLSIATTSLPNGTAGVAYQSGVTIAPTGGTGGGTYAFSAIGLPTGYSIDPALGTISGTTTQNGLFTPTFTVTDQDAQIATKQIGLTISGTPGLFFQTSSPLPPATPNVVYSTAIQAGGGNGVFTLSASGLPNWLNFNTQTGVLSGTPPSALPVTFQLTVSDSVNQSLSQYFTLPVNEALTFDTASPLPPASAGLPYSETLTASGGSGSYTWSATNLPLWLSLSPAGVFSGTPTQSGPVTVRVTVKDTQNNSTGETFTLPVNSALTIDTASPLSPATANFPYSANFTASGGAGNYQWSATGLPGGFTLSPAGALLGTAGSANPLSFSVTVQDSLNKTAAENVTLPVNSAIALGATPLPIGTVQVPYAASLTASGGAPGYTFTATGLPVWLNLTKGGYLSGTPTASGQSTIQVTVTDSQTNAKTTPVTLTVNASLTIATASLPQATVSAPYSTALAATGGVGPYTWSSASLPNGLSISAAGVLSGTIAQAGPYPVEVTVWDGETSAASQKYTLLVGTGAPLSFATPTTLPSCVQNALCSNQIAATGGIPPYTFSVAPNANLGGLSLSSAGLLSGTPTSGGPIGVPVILTDQLASIPATFTQPVIASLVINTSSLPNGTVGENYGIAMSASGGGAAPYSWSLVPGSGSLPAGLNLDARGGNIYGKPAAAGTSTFSVQVTDGQQTSQPKQLSLTIAPALTSLTTTPLLIQSALQLPPGMSGTPYTQTLSASGGAGQYTWALTGGALPAGLTLALSGAITGTPTVAQTANFQASVSDTSGNSLSAGFTIVVASSTTVALLTPNPLPNGAVGVIYSYGIQVLGGTPPYFYAITAGQVPPGLTFDATNGTFSGTPTQAGNFGLVLTVTDSGGSSSAQTASLTGKPIARAATSSNYTIQIAAPGGFQITTAQNLPIATLAQVYSTTLAASGGAAPYTWTLVNGTLPAGLTLNPGGSIAGTPAQPGLASLVIKATDTTGASATGAFLLQVANPNAPAISPLPLPPSGTVGQAYQSSLTAVGGHTPYSWSVAVGPLPPGVTLNAQTGALSGTPTQAGSFPFTAEVTDSQQVTATQAFTIPVNALTLQITPPTIPTALANSPYSLSLSVAGGTPPYNWSLSAGGLLSGFTIDPSTGAITGTPTVPGTYPFTITVIDANFGMATQTFQLTVGPATTLSISTASVPAGTVGAAYDFGLLASNSNPPLTWSATGALPPGIQLLASSGILAGTPTTAGSYTFTAQVTDSTSAKAQATFTLVVSAPPLTIVTTSLPNGAIATAYSQTVQSSGGTNPITWSVSAGTLPAGLSLGATTGTISGTPSAAGSFTFTVKATDSSGVAAQQPFTVTIAGPPAVPAITLSGLPATSKPGDQPTVTITLASPYPLPITVAAALSISPNSGNSTDLMFSNGSRTTQITIPANATTATLQFQTGTLPGTIELSLSLSAAGVNITPTVPPSATTTIAGAAPVISSVTVTTTSTGIQVTVAGASTTLDMKTATFQFEPAAGATLQTTSFTIDVSALFAAWYSSAASLATGSQFSLTVPFTIGGNVSAIASVSVTLTNSVGASAAVSANVP